MKREIEQKKSFRQDLKREARGKYRNLLRPDGELKYVIAKLANDESLDANYRDHPLRHNLEGKRECHLRHDFLLVYSYEGEDLLILEGLGTHSETLGL